MKIKRGHLGLALLAAVAIVAFGAACGGGGSAASGTSPTPIAGARGDGGGFSGGGPGGGPGGGFVSGTIKSVSGNAVTVTTSNNGGDVQFQLSDSVTVQKVVDATVFDLVPGKFVTVRGQQNADGTIEATSVQLGDEPLQRSPGASPRGTPGPGRSPRGGNGGNGGFGGGNGANGGSVTSGTIKSVGNNTVTVTSNRGDIVVQLPNTAVIRATVAGTTSDVVMGQTVLARGQSDASGVVVATSVQVGQLGQLGFGGPQGQ